jgi:hypothetical protein
LKTHNNPTTSFVSTRYARNCGLLEKIRLLAKNQITCKKSTKALFLKNLWKKVAEIIGTFSLIFLFLQHQEAIYRPKNSENMNNWIY